MSVVSTLAISSSFSIISVSSSLDDKALLCWGSISVASASTIGELISVSTCGVASSIGKLLIGTFVIVLTVN